MRRGTLQALLTLLAAAYGSLLVLRHDSPPGAEPPGGGPVLRRVLELRRGDVLEAVVEQRGSDVALRLRDPRGDLFLEVDSPNGTRGNERLLALAERPGRFALEIALRPGAPLAGFRRRLVAVRPAAGADRLAAAAELAFYAGERARKSGDRRQLPVAVEHYRRALRAQLAIPDAAAAARSAARLGKVYAELGELAQARDACARALRLGLEDRDERLSTRNHLGALHYRLGAHEEALRTLASSPALAVPGSDPLYEAAALNNLALAYQALGEHGEAEVRFRRALEIWRALGSRCDEALTAANLGELYVERGHAPRALELFEGALALGCGGPERLVPLLRSRAMAYERLGRREAARASYAQALAQARASGRPADEALVLNALGGLLLGEGEAERALAVHREALELATAGGDLRGQANALSNLGHIHERRGRPRAALPLLARSRALYARLGEPSAEAAVLYAMARAERRLGRLRDALASIEASVETLEALRERVPAEGLRSSFVEARFDAYELAIDVLMRLHRRSPGAGFDVAAFEAAERTRARTLVDRLEVSRAARTLREVQDELPDDRTVVLAYFLGEERGFAWRVDRTRFSAHELPGRAEVESLARRAHRLARSAAPHAVGEAQSALAELSRCVLAPVAGGGLPERVLVVADGALALVPFAVLPDPAHPGEPLLARREVVALPAASFAAERPRRRADRASADRLLAVVADPVFGPEDPRLRPSGPSAALRPAPARAGEPGLDTLPRLGFASGEAERILALSPGGRGLLLLGFDANRRAVLGGSLAPYRIVHFATHGLVHPDPERSSLVLSRVDPRGAPREGLLRAGELARMDLPAELVVLSACHTAAGKEVRGEGVRSLSRAALRAGARRVLVSLWAADDEATAELMTLFYRGLFERRLSPAAALREAQLALRRHPRWSAPAYWAGFLLEGDWRPMPLP